MKITIAEVLTLKPCKYAEEWATKKYKKPQEIKSVVKDLKKIKKLDWANWLVTRLLSKDDKVRYAIFAAEQVINIYEKKYPGDLRPRKAIDAAKKYLELKTKDAAADAADAAADAASDAADAAAYAARAAADAARAAADAAYAAADAAAYAVADTKKMKLKIINYGVKLLENKKEKGEI